MIELEFVENDSTEKFFNLMIAIIKRPVLAKSDNEIKTNTARLLCPSRATLPKAAQMTI